MKDIKHLILSLTVMLALIASGFTLSERRTAAVAPPTGGIVNLDTVQIHLSNCGLEGSICLPITLGDALKLRVTDNGTPISVDVMSGCDFDTISAYTYSNLFGAGAAGPYILTSWNVNGTSYTDTFQNMPQLVDLMNGWDPMGNWVLNPTNLLISGGNSANTYDTMQVWVSVLQSPSYIGYNLGITPNGTSLSFTRGFHEVILEDTINNMADTFYVHAFCSETINDQLVAGNSVTECLPNTDLLGGVASIGFCSGDPSNAAVTFTLDPVQNCVTYQAIQGGSASACVILCDSTGFCDTTYFNISVSDPSQVHQVDLEIGVGEVYSYCFDSTNTSGQVTSVSMCGTSSNGFATYAIDTLTNCVNIAGIAEGGTEYGCVVVCTDLGACDTTYFSTFVRRFGPEIVYDTLFLNQSGTYCVDQYLVTPIQQFATILEPNLAFMAYTLNNSTYCVQYSGLALGTDTIGMAISNVNGQADTTYLILTVLPPQPQTIVDTLMVGDMVTYCLPLAELAGTSYSVTNICPDQGSGQVQFGIDTLTLCLDYTGILPGTDTACIVICDNLGSCDTFTFLITAFDTTANLLPPSASSDAAVTDVNIPVSFSILNNDLVPGTIVGGIILIPITPSGTPTHGSVTIDPVTNLVTYTPPTDFCDTLDHFMYLVCNAAGCDTATVTVMILCGPDTDDELVFYQGFSPNDDSMNDNFVIKNADKYPGNEVKVFNRWGNQVFYAKNYRNNWDGTWQEKPLPDGIYFYIFDNGKGEIHSDCVAIRR